MRTALVIILCGLLLPAITVSQTIEGAQSAIEIKQYDSAQNILKKLLDDDKNNVAAISLLAKVYYLKGQHDRADREIRKAIGKDKTYIPAYLVRAEILINRPRKSMIENRNLAIVTLNRALEISPHEKAVLFMLQEVCFDNGRYEDAYNTVQTIKSIYPDEVEGYLACINILPYYELNVLKSSSLIEENLFKIYYNEALTPEQLFTMGWNFLICDKPDEAYECFRKGIDTGNPVSYDIFLTAGLAAYSANKFLESHDYYI
ncbi:tetratricopeptide repeat protein, partial [candidate division KSB1 bacterium]